MSTINGKPFSSPKNINLTKGLLRFGAKQAAAAIPYDSLSYGLYINSAGQLVFSSLGSSAVIGGGGSGTPTWETLFTADQTFTITPDTTFTIAGNRATATDVLTITNTAGGSGDCIQITNAGTGKDITGTSDTWSITKDGVAVFVGVTPGGDITSTAVAIDWDLMDNNASALSFDSTGQAGILEIVTTDGSELVKFSKNIQVTDGIATCISTSNTVSNILVTNNTVTTFGADANSSGVVVIRSTSLTTGALLQLQATEGTLNGGFYLVCRDVTGSSNVCTIAEDGKITIVGADGSTMLAITAGDVTVGGSIALTDNDNAASFTVTNNTATSASVAVIAGNGVHTGNTTSSFMTITASGLTTGTVLYIPAAAATTSVGVIDVIGAALTSGSLVRLTTSTAAFTTGGKALEIDLVAAVAGNGVTVTTTGVYTGTGLAILSAGAMTTGVLLQLTSTTGLTSGSLLRATTSTAGAVATNGVISIRATGAYTSTSNAGLLDVSASALVGTGTVVNITSTAANQLTNTLLNVEASGFTTGYTGSMVVIKSPTTTGAGIVLSLIADGITSGGTAMKISTTALTTGDALLITNGTSAITTGSLLKISASGVGTIATDGVVSFNHAGIFDSTSNAGFVNITANASLSGTILAVNATGLTTGIAIYAPSAEAGLTTGKYLSLGDVFTVAKYGATVIAGTASGTAALTVTDGDVVVTSGRIISTAGNITLTAGTLITTPQAILNANTAISVTHGVTKIANNAASTHALADGVEGQRKTIVCTAYADDAVITPSNLANGTTITLNAVGDAVDLVFLGTEWWATNLYGAAAIA